ncbi:hypothetical protein BJ508DRAFT_417440 [Ascobolus immersus RN42]|uniref:Uncharacterized protein n=1 Tax=Ascobolus immersus RN42 TaxID=1160509 RepID=A0A3N4HW66_ASCIM|nr:hypothetical protein BJ508DRAFT_417440 [Ascobolus immersus RN42]
MYGTIWKIMGYKGNYCVAISGRERKPIAKREYDENGPKALQIPHTQSNRDILHIYTPESTRVATMVESNLRRSDEKARTRYSNQNPGWRNI